MNESSMEFRGVLHSSVNLSTLILLEVEELSLPASTPDVNHGSPGHIKTS